MQPTLFYAWESDAEPKTNRWFVRDAAERSIKSLMKQATVEDAPRLDSDTQGTSGTPEIAGTIFTKIKGAGLFLGDVTLVGRIGGHKKTPNPNVLIELGYAAGVIGWDRIILVMNMHYGPPEDLPFDLKHRRFPITYTLGPDDDKPEVRATLVNSLTSAIQVALNAEHDAVQQIIRGLTINCLRLIRRHADHDVFRTTEPTKMGEVLVNAWIHNAVDRLLSLGMIYTDLIPTESNHGYFWTYHGILVLKKLGFRAV